MEFNVYSEFDDNLKQEWNSLLEESVCDVPFLRYEYLKTWWQTRGGGEWQQPELLLITAHRQDILVGIAPLFIAEHQGRRAVLLLGSIEVSDYLDLIVRQADLKDFVEELMHRLQAEDIPAWDVLDLYNLLDHSPTLAVLKEAAEQCGCSYHAEAVQPSPFIALPEDGSWETYLANIKKKQRHEIRRKIRNLENPSFLTSRWYLVEDAEQLEAEIEAFLDMMAHDRDKAAFLTDIMREHMRNTARVIYEMGALYLAVIEINGQRAAFKFCFDYRDRIWAYNSAVNYDLWDHSPGWVLLSYVIRWSIENGRTEFDFMRGDEEYKYRFGAEDRQVMRVIIQPN